MRSTRVISMCAVLLTLASPYLGLAEPTRPSYSTLVVEYVGEMDRYAPPVVISTSRKRESGTNNISFQNRVIFLFTSRWCLRQSLMRLRNCRY